MDILCSVVLHVGGQTTSHDQLIWCMSLSPVTLAAVVLFWIWFGLLVFTASYVHMCAILWTPSAYGHCQATGCVCVCVCVCVYTLREHLIFPLTPCDQPLWHAGHRHHLLPPLLHVPLLQAIPKICKYNTVYIFHISYNERKYFGCVIITVWRLYWKWMKTANCLMRVAQYNGWSKA